MDRKLTNSELDKLIDFRHPDDSNEVKLLMIKHYKFIGVYLSELSEEELEVING